MKNKIIILITIILYPIIWNILNLFLNNDNYLKAISLFTLIILFVLFHKTLFLSNFIKKIESLFYEIKISNTNLQNEDQVDVVIKPRPGAIKGLKTKFYGTGYSVKIHDFNLHDSMVYVSDEINLNIGQEIPFIIFRQMHVNPKNQGVIKIDKKRLLTNYMDMTQAERTAYLYWLNKGRTGHVENFSFIVIYLKGLAYRFFEEGKNKKEIYLEVVRLYQEYGFQYPEVTQDCLKLVELFSTDFDIVKSYTLMDWQELVKSKLKLEFNNEKYYSLMWNVIALKKETLNIETVLWFYLKDPKVAKLIHNQQSLECIKQILIEYLDLGLLSDLKIIKNKKEENFKNYIYRYTSLELDVATSDKVKKNIVKVIDELKFFLLSFHNHSFIESYSLLPVKYKKAIHHPLRENINDLYNKANIVSIKEIMLSCNMTFETLDLQQSKEIAKILNDNFIAIEPDSRLTRKSYELDQKVYLFKQGTNLLCKNLNYLKARLVVDTIYSASSNFLDDTQKTTILNFCLNSWTDLKNEKERIWSRMILLDEMKEEDLRLSLKTDLNTEESSAFISLISDNREPFGIKDTRLNKIIELFS